MTGLDVIHANDNIHPDCPLRLEDAIKYGFPYGGMTVSGLRRESARGRLTIERIANKDFTSLRSIENYRTTNQEAPAFSSSRFSAHPKV